MMQYCEKFTSPFFTPLDISEYYNLNIDKLSINECSEGSIKLKRGFPTGMCTYLGIPFLTGKNGCLENNIILLGSNEVVLKLTDPMQTNYIIFLHVADFKSVESGSDGMLEKPVRGMPVLGDLVSDYYLKYKDGSTQKIPIKRRFAISEPITGTGHCFEAMPNVKPYIFDTISEDVDQGKPTPNLWGESQCRVRAGNRSYEPPFIYLYAYKNPYPEKELMEIALCPADSTSMLFGVTFSNLESNPIRWESRKKVVVEITPSQIVNSKNAAQSMDIDLGQIISVNPVLDYNNSCWDTGYNNKQPIECNSMFVVEYAAHPNAILYIGDNDKTKLEDIDKVYYNHSINSYVDFYKINQALQEVKIRVTEKETGRVAPVKIHIHGEAGEYLPPVNGNRKPSPYWFEDYGTNYINVNHICEYINGEAEFRLPLGNIYLEVSKGFEIAPFRKVLRIEPETDVINIELEHVLPWRAKGWVTADTHVHFLSPQTALLEAEAEGVNVVNLLASQWGELFTNVGDFDGKTTLGSSENGGSGEYLVRVATENRQFILGHISLLGYEGKMILPLATGGPTESALGDPLEETLCGWAEKCIQQNGITILPHFPNPRAEGAAAIVLNLIDAVEMKSGGDLYKGISAYSLSDWYRYLNCGYHVAAVGGTDKMEASTAVGTIRTYARIHDCIFTYESWKDAVRKGETFVTYGPLLDFHINGKSMGDTIKLPSTGGTLDVDWEVSSVTVPVTAIELIVNGITLEVERRDPLLINHKGTFSLKVAKSCWIALRVRGGYQDKPEVIAAHASAIMIYAGGSSVFDRMDAMTILDQIEGSMAYIKTIATKAEEKVYKKLMMTLTSAHRELHNNMHRNGIFHNHNILEEHH